MADFNSTLIRGNLRVTEDTYGTKFHSDASASTDLTVIPSSSGVALETGNGDGNVSAWVWREKWDAANFGIFHDNSSNLLKFVGDNTARLSVGLGSSDPHVYVSSNLYTSGSIYEGGTALSNKYLGINSNAASASIPYGFSSRGTSDWSGVSGTMVTDWSTSASGDVMFKDDGGKINVITDGRFYQGIDIYGSSQRVLDTYDLSHTQWGDAYTVDGEHPSAFLHLTGGTMSGDITLGSGASGQTQVGANIIMGIQNDSYGLLPYANNWNQIGADGRYWYRSFITNMYSNSIVTNKTQVSGVHNDTYYASNLCRHFYGGTPTEFVIKTKIKYVSGTHMPIVRIYGYAYGEQSPIELRIGFYIYGGELGWAGAVSTGAWKPEVYLFSYTADSEKWVAVGLKGSCYFCGFQVDTQVGASGAFGSDFQLDGWTTEHNGADTSQSIIPAVGSNDCVAVSYRTMKTDISGSASYATSAGDADTLDGHGISYFITTDNILQQTVYGAAVANTATNATKLTTDAGSATQPVYFSNGVPVATTYALNKTVPADAVFTDHTYNFDGTTFYSGNASNAEHNANSMVYNGMYWYTSNGPSTTLGATVSDGAMYVQAYSTDWAAQIAQDYRNGSLFVRGSNGSSSSWSPWNKILQRNEKNISYTNLGVYYNGGNTHPYIHIQFPDKGYTWAMLTLEFTIKKSYSDGQGGKLIVNGCWWSSQDLWQYFNSVHDRCLEGITVYSLDKRNIYIGGIDGWGTLSLDRITCGDGITGYDISEIVIEGVSELPANCNTATKHIRALTSDLSNYLQKSGGTMSGDLTMDTHEIIFRSGTGITSYSSGGSDPDYYLGFYSDEGKYRFDADDGSYTATLQFANFSASRSFYFPNNTGTIALTSDFTGTTSGGNWTSLTINGTTANIPQGGGGSSGVSSIGGATGTITLGTGLTMSNNTLSTTGLMGVNGGLATTQFNLLGHPNADVIIRSQGQSNTVIGADNGGIILVTNVSNSGSGVLLDTNSVSAYYYVSFPDKTADSNETIAMVSDIPTNNNQLSNGAGYITSSGSCSYASSAGYTSSIARTWQRDNDCDIALQNYHNRTTVFMYDDSSANKPSGSSAGYILANAWDWGGGGSLLAQDHGTGGRLYTRHRPCSDNYDASWGSWNAVAWVSEIPTNNNQLTNGAGYITGITSAMVTTALGYTPGTSNFTGYTASNKLSTDYIQNDAGYITSSGSCASATTATTATKIAYTTTAPSQINPGGLKVVVLTSEPAEYKQGYIYFIVGS